MKLKPILMAGVATAALSGAIMTSALAADDQVEETRALNLQALADARSENGSTMPMPMPKPPTTTDDKREADGQGGPTFEGPPGPDDMGIDDSTDADDDEEEDNSGETPPPDEILLH